MNTQTVLAIMLLRELGRAEGLLKMDDLATRLDLTVSYTTKLLRIVLRAGLVEACRGTTGGYRLAKPPTKLSVVEVWERIEGGIIPDGPADALDLRQLRQWLRDPIKHALRSLTIADLADPHRKPR